MATETTTLSGRGTISAADIRPGDVLLYAPKGIFGWIIRIKTWHAVAHTEVFIGKGYSVASRDGIGVGLYPLRTEQLKHVCRPLVPFDMVKGLEYFKSTVGTPYGWLDLLNFAGLKIDHKGIVCSSFATEFVRASGYDPFNGEPANLIAPFQFLTSPYYQVFDVV